MIGVTAALFKDERKTPWLKLKLVIVVITGSKMSKQSFINEASRGSRLQDFDMLPTNLDTSCSVIRTNLLSSVAQGSESMKRLITFMHFTARVPLMLVIFEAKKSANLWLSSTRLHEMGGDDQLCDVEVCQQSWRGPFDGVGFLELG